MSIQPLDYLAFLADLEAKKAVIEAAIVSIRAAIPLLTQLGDGQAEIGTPISFAPSFTNGDIPDGAFLGKGVPEAAKLLLEIVKKKQTTREIADALERGGIESNSGNFLSVVHAVLNRARRSPNSPLVKLGGHWGLKEWYPKGIISAAKGPQSKKAKKKNRKATSSGSKLKEQAYAKGPQPVAEVVISADRNPAERVLEILRVNSSVAFSVQKIAEMLTLKPSSVNLILGNLTRGHKVDKKADGKYIAVTSQMSAAV